MNDPLSQDKETYAAIIEKIQSEQSAVGIDAQYTHAVIIQFLRDITRRLEAIEQKLNS